MARLLLLSALLAGVSCKQLDKDDKDLYKTFRFDYGPAGRDYVYGYIPKVGSDQGGLPLYVWMTGTGLKTETEADHEILLEMAGRGYVAAQLDYPNDDYKFLCSFLDEKAAEMFMGEDSALGRLCKMKEVDCSKGVAVHGFSQGAHLASIAGNYNANITAALLYGNGNFAFGESERIGLEEMANSTECLRYEGPPKHRLDRTQVRSIAGGSDKFMGQVIPGVIGHQRVTTGYDCGDLQTDCIQPDGSGYYVIAVPISGTFHNFFYKQMPKESGMKNTILDKTWEDCSLPWCSTPCLDWLASAARRFALQPVGSGKDAPATGTSAPEAPATAAPDASDAAKPGLENATAATAGAGQSAQGSEDAQGAGDQVGQPGFEEAGKPEPEPEQGSDEAAGAGGGQDDQDAAGAEEKFAMQPAALRAGSASRVGGLACSTALVACLLALAGGGMAWVRRWRAAESESYAIVREAMVDQESQIQQAAEASHI